MTDQPAETIDGSSEPRVPHDPKDLRNAAKAVRGRQSWGHLDRVLRDNLADRLEAWADDLERGTDPDVAEYQRGHQDGYNRALAAVVDGKYPALMERLRPLEAAVLDAAKTFTANLWTEDYRYLDQLADAVRALQEAEQ